MWDSSLTFRFMSLAKSFALVGLVFASTACGALERSAGDARAADVVVSKNEPPSSCRPIGEVTGDVILGSLESAKQDLVKNAAEGGGNYVAVDMTERHPGGYGMVGRLFQCPAGATQIALEPVAKAPVASADER